MSDLAKFYEKKLHSLFISLSSAQNSKEKGPSQTLPFFPLPQKGSYILVDLLSHWWKGCGWQGVFPCYFCKVILNSPKGCCLILTESFVLCAWFWVVFCYKWNIKWLVLTMATLAKQHKKLCQGKVWRVTRKGQSEMHCLNVTIFLKKQKFHRSWKYEFCRISLILGSRWTIVKALI